MLYHIKIKNNNNNKTEPLCPGDSSVSLLLVICGTIKSELGGVGETVEVCGDVASVKLGKDWPRHEYAGTWTLKVLGVGDLLNNDRLQLLYLF